MAVVLTCECGTRFEVDDHHADQVVTCPACALPVQARSDVLRSRLDWFALGSLCAALVGAFTLAGSLVAILLAGIALFRIHRSPTLYRGTDRALIAMGLAVVCALFTWKVGPTEAARAVAVWLRRLQWSGQVETIAAPVVTTRDGVCQLPRPKGDWFLLRAGSHLDGSIDDLVVRRDVVLVNPSLHAVIDLYRETEGVQPMLEDQRLTILDDLMAPRSPLIGADDSENPLRTVPREPMDEISRALPDIERFRAHEWSFTLRRGGRNWHFLIRAYRARGARGSAEYYLLRIYAPPHAFHTAAEQFRAIANSVRFPS